jgi:argininosuccinate synthase
MIISSVYNNKNRVPVNKQAVKEFFTDHNLYSDSQELTIKQPVELKIEYFKKATVDMALASSVNSDIDISNYERSAVALRKMTECRPKKLSKLARLLQHHNGGKKKAALVIINSMSQQGFLKIIGDEVVYF